MNTPWAILKCKFNDDDSEPFPDDYYENLFTRAGVGTNNMVDYFRDVSHGNLDLGESRVFGWFTLPRRRAEYAGSGANPAGRIQAVSWAREAAASAGVPLDDYWGVLVCMNVPTDLWGGGGRQAFCDNHSTIPPYLGQEMGHAYGLSHSRENGSEADYRDPWDVMSTWNGCHIAPDPRYRYTGPGLNAWNMRGRRWLDETRVWRGGAGSHETTVELRPLHRHDLPGYLAAELGSRLLIEYRSRAGWDAAIPRSTVLLHRFADNHSYLLRNSRGRHDFSTGDFFEMGLPGVNYTRLEVLSIDDSNRVATLRLRQDVVQKADPADRALVSGQLLGAVAIDGGGAILVNGRVVPIPPLDPFLGVLEQIVLYRSLDAASQPTGAEAARRDALEAITQSVAEMAGRLGPLHVPAPAVKQPHEQASVQKTRRGWLKKSPRG